MATACIPAFFFFDPQTEKQTGAAVKIRAGAKPKKEKRLFCAACRHPVTHQDERIPVQGGHEHTFINPHGITYRIGCFHDAAGCAPVGEATQEFTWFSGYTWRIALCAHCRAQLGWRFQSDGDYFYGLITAQLTSAGPARN